MEEGVETTATTTTISSNSLFELLPFLAHTLLAQLDPAATAAVASTCRSWRDAVKASLQALQPKSERALPFVAGCSQLQRLELCHTAPCKCGAAAGHSQHFACISSLRRLTHLSLKVSQTATWLGQALTCSANDLWFLVHLTRLQVLNLNHQPCLQQPGVFSPLRQLRVLQQLCASITGTGWLPCYSSWQVLGELSSLRALDLSGWSRCVVTRACAEGPAGSGSTEHGGQAGAAAGSIERTTHAPLHLLRTLSRLQQLRLADWDEPPSAAGLAALQQLPGLTSIDLSQCLCGQPRDGMPPAPGGAAGVHSQVSLLELLQGRTWQQQQQQQQQQRRQDEAGAAAAERSTAAGAAQLVPSPVPPAVGQFSNLQRLACVCMPVSMGADVWAGLPALTFLDVSCCSRLRGHGLSQLRRLQELVATDCSLDYDAMCELLASGGGQLRVVDMQRSTVILHGHGDTAARLLAGRYRRPQLLAATSQLQQQAGGGAAGGASASASSSRRDVVDVSGAEAVASLSLSGPASNAQVSEQQPGLRALLMLDTQLAFEAFVWTAPVSEQHDHPSLLLLDMVAAAGRQWLQTLQTLHLGMASSALTAAVLEQLVPAASSSLRELRVVSCSLPTSLTGCWQGLAAATGLRQLDLGGSTHSRHAHAAHSGVNPTVALLATAVARMPHLDSLALPGWRFFFATLKLLANLSSLRSVDLSHGHDVTDSTLWSLTHLTGLSRLHLAGASVATDAIFSLVLVQLSQLRHLDVSGIDKFTARSLRAVVEQLRGLTWLDLRSTACVADEAAARALTQLPSLRWLGVTLGAERAAAYMPASARVRVLQQAGEVATRGSQAGDVAAYSHLALFGDCQSLRVLCLGCSTPAVTQLCRSLLPPWIEVR